MIWSREQVKALLDRALSFSKAEQARVNLDGGDRGHVRFARNTATTAGSSTGYTLGITATFGKKSGVVTTNEFDDASLERAMRSAEDVARISPDNPELMDELPPQQYSTPSGFFDDIANVSPEWRAGSVGEAIALSKQKDVVSAGFVETSATLTAVANSKGAFAHYAYTTADYNLTARTQDSTGSGWASKSYNELRQLEPGRLAATAIDKAYQSRSPVAVDPGKYTVVLEPAALADLIFFMFFFADARQSDEGRSFFSKKGGGNRIGEQVLNEHVSIYSDPLHPLAPSAPFDGEGIPNRRVDWVGKGIVKNLIYSRYWAQKQQKDMMATATNLIMDGGDASMEGLIKSTDRGILVTRFWYIRPLDPQALLLTGLTRDGLFLIEKGAVTRPIKNMRWNESPIAALNNIEAMTPAERVVSGEGYGTGGPSAVCPAAKIAAFTFSSASDAV